MTSVICWWADVQHWGAELAEYAVRLSIVEKSLIKYTLKTLKMKYYKCVPYKKSLRARARKHMHTNTHTHLQTVKKGVESLLKSLLS